MIILGIITGFIALVSGLRWLYNYQKSGGWEGGVGWGISFWFFGSIWVLAFLLCFRVNMGTNNLTGYIYSSETKFGYITGHIRFSEHAGQDAQPSFCTRADSEAGRLIKELTGTGQKAIITEPPFFYLTNNPFACGTTEMKVELSN